MGRAQLWPSDGRWAQDMGGMGSPNTAREKEDLRKARRTFLDGSSALRRLLGAWLVSLGMALTVLFSSHPAEAQALTRESEVLYVGDRAVVTLRGSVGGYTARERVTSANERLERALTKSTPPKVTLDDVELGTRVLVDGEPVFLVTRGDVDVQIGETPHFLAEESAKRLERAIAEVRRQRSQPFMLQALLTAGAGTLVYAILLWVLSRLATRLTRRLSLAAASRADRLQARGVSILDTGRILRFIRWVFVALTWVMGAGATIIWLAFVLSQFPYTRAWGEGLGANLRRLAWEVAVSIGRAVPELLVVIFIAVAARTAIAISSWFFDRVEERRLLVAWMDPELVRPTRRVFGFLVWVFALAMAYPYLPGSDTEAFKGLSVLVGLMASLGSSSVINQAASGLTLMYARTIKVGDFIRIDDAEGTVVEIGVVATRIRTGLGEMLVLPNAKILSSMMKNYSQPVHGDGCVLDVEVSVGYTTPWRMAQTLLLQAADDVPGLSPTPPPFVRQVALNDYNATYRLVARTPEEDPIVRARILSDLRGAVRDIFERNGVDIISSQYLAIAQREAVPRAVSPESLRS